MIIKALNENNVDIITKFLLSEDSFVVKDVSSSKKIISDINAIIKKRLNHKEDKDHFIYALFDEEEIKLAIIFDANGKIINFTPSSNLSVAEGKAFMKEFSKLYKEQIKHFSIEVKESHLQFLNEIGFKNSQFLQNNSLNEDNYTYYFLLKYYTV